MGVGGVGCNPGGNMPSTGGSSDMSQFEAGLKGKSEQELIEMLGDTKLNSDQRKSIVDELIRRATDAKEESGTGGGSGAGSGDDDIGGADDIGGGGGTGGFTNDLLALLDKATSGTLTDEEKDKLKKLLKELGMSNSDVEKIFKDLTTKEPDASGSGNGGAGAGSEDSDEI